MLTRRQLLPMGAIWPHAIRLLGQSSGEWTPEWDRAVLDASLAAQDAAYDPEERMVTRRIGPQYQYHTNLRSTVVHPTRESLEYALYLLEAGGDEHRDRALAVLDRVLDLQVTDPDSKWYGIWGWYMEEPPPQMSPADWNWADFNGSTLVLIEFRHGASLPQQTRSRVRDAIRHAAHSVKRRNVTMSYTNIAVKGTFVTTSAAELLDDDELAVYAADRRHRLASHIDSTGSFDEYNSPTYARVTIANLTRMMMYVRGADARALAEKIHHRAWLHLASHWHAPARQLAGPMSRCYQTDIGSPLWLQKSLGGRLEFSTLEDVGAGRAEASGEVAVLDWNCPGELAPLFLTLTQPKLHREIFQAAREPAPPVQGTTWLDPAFCLGSVNLGDFWVQRRPLLAYWGDTKRPARYLQLRLMKDDYDFSSGLISSVQEKNSVLGFVHFRYPGGDKHVSLDPVQNGAFECRRLRVRADLVGVPDPVGVIIDGKPAELPVRDLLPGARVAIDLGGVHLWIRFPMSEFGQAKPLLSVEREDGLLTVSLDLHRSSEPATIRWSEVQTAWAALNLVMDAAEESLADLNLRCSIGRIEFRDSSGSGLTRGTGVVRVVWESPSGRLWIDGARGIAPVDQQQAAYQAGVRSAPVPYVRLSEAMMSQ